MVSPARVALVTLAGALVLSGCSAEELPRLGMPEPVTNQGPRILLLWQSAWLAALIIGAIVWGMIIWASIAYRRRHADDPLPKQTRYNLPIEVFYTVVPLIIISVFFFYTARDESEITRVSDNPDVTINVNAFQWSWQFNYLDEDVSVTGSPGQPPTLVLPKGKTVKFKLTSQDVIHSFWVPAFLYKLDVVPGHPNAFEIVPEKLGTYVGKCAELCGVDHSRMLFNVDIVEPEQYDQYLAGLKAGSAK
jgi:cytochrome c oxidase subunit 2